MPLLLSVIAEAALAVVEVQEPRVAVTSAVDPCAGGRPAADQVVDLCAGAAPAVAQVPTPRVVALSVVDLGAGARTADPLRA
jgi:hypothetical protein